MTMTLWPISDWLGKLRQWPGSKKRKSDEIQSDVMRDHESSSSDETSLTSEVDECRGEPPPNDSADQKASTLDELEVGQMILVRAGRNGTQRAKVVSAAQVADDGAFITVRKYRAKSDSWTKPVSCYAHQIVEPVAPAEDQAPT